MNSANFSKQKIFLRQMIVAAKKINERDKYIYKKPAVDVKKRLVEYPEKIKDKQVKTRIRTRINNIEKILKKLKKKYPKKNLKKIQEKINSLKKKL